MPKKGYLNLLRRKLLLMTKMLLKDMAAAASMGFNLPAAANGMSMTL